jgi:hypothetical protein
MQLDLSGEDAGVLYDLLQAYLPGVRREAARTEAHGLRHQLILRQELCERLLDQLAASGVVPAEASRPA